MPRVALSLETIGALDDGVAGAIINAEINTAVADLEDRGDDGKERKVVIELSMLRDEHGKYHMTVKAQAKMPPRQVAPTNALMGQDAASKVAKLVFQDDNAERADQPTLPFDADKASRRRKPKAEGADLDGTAAE